MTQNIVPKDCSYGCNTRIYWNTSTSEYWEVFSKKKHVCPSRSVNNNKPMSVSWDTNTNRPFYNKKPWPQKPKMSNSLELISGPIDTIQKKYEVLSDIVSEHNGKVHGSQSHNVANNSLSLILYYEVPLGQRDKVKRKFDNLVRNEVVLRKNNY
jgi:hypothetical protein